MPANWIYSFAIWRAAKAARDRAVEEVQRNAAVRPLDAMLAVVLAGASADAFINELAHSINSDISAELRGTPLEKPLRVLGEVLDELEEGHASTQIKFLLAGQILGRPFSRGENPFQDFSIVMTLRNHFMHLKHRDSFVDLGGGREAVIWPKYVTALKERGLARGWDHLEGAAGEMMASWFEAVLTPEIAAWACSSVEAMVRAVLAECPSVEIGRHPLWGFHVSWGGKFPGVTG